MKDTALDARLMSAAGFVRQGAIFADIGTDHAHLPVFLLESGKIERAVLSDVNEGPLASARRNIEHYGYSDRVTLRLCDGAEELSGLGVTDYAICGMGGELIRDIIARAPHLAEMGIRLILQPMTKQSTLREYLFGAGFAILSERYSYADGKYYVTMLAEYSGERKSVDPISLELGMIPDKDGGRVEYIGYLEVKLRAYKRALAGKARGGEDTTDEQTMIEAIEERINEIRGSIQ